MQDLEIYEIPTFGTEIVFSQATGQAVWRDTNQTAGTGDETWT
jgi:hypothetical protein